MRAGGREQPDSHEDARLSQLYQEVTELQDFLSHSTLPAVQLDNSHTEISGWILFSTHSKWIGDWKKPEEFLFRIPLGSQILEFPFALPAKQGDLILRQRAQ